VALLTGRQGVVENDQLDLVVLDEIMQFLDLAAADQILGRRLMPSHVDEANSLGSGRTRQLPKLLGIFTRRGILAIQVHQDGPFTTAGTFEEQRRLPLVVARLGLLAIPG